MYGTVAPGSFPWAGLGVGVGASVYCGHISSCFFFFLKILLLFQSSSFISNTTANALLLSGAIQYCLTVLKNLLPYWRNYNPAEVNKYSVVNYHNNFSNISSGPSCSKLMMLFVNVSLKL